MTGPPNSASRPTVPPIAIAAAAPTARVSVATAMITNIRNAVSSELIDERAADADAGDGRAELAGWSGQTASRTSAPAVAPTSWATM